MKALSNERGVIAATAMDQRGNLQKALSTFRGVDVHEITPAMMSEFKVAVTRIPDTSLSVSPSPVRVGLFAACGKFAAWLDLFMTPWWRKTDSNHRSRSCERLFWALPIGDGGTKGGATYRFRSAWSGCP